jgi:hypothetical protein
MVCRVVAVMVSVMMAVMVIVLEAVIVAVTVFGNLDLKLQVAFVFSLCKLVRHVG